MRVLGSINEIEHKKEGIQYPFGATIQNETETILGTEVVEELYGDILMNLYRVLELGLVNPNGVQDSRDTSFQLADALQKLPNSVTDVFGILNKSGNQWIYNKNVSGYSIQNFSFNAIASESYVNGLPYVFKDSTGNEYPFTSPTGFNALDPIMIIFNTDGVKAYTLNYKKTDSDTLINILGAPLSYNSGNQLYYNAISSVITDIPSNYGVLAKIRYVSGIAELTMLDAFFDAGYFICEVHQDSNNTYSFYLVEKENLDNVRLLTGVTFGTTNKYYYSENTLWAVDNTNLMSKYNVDYVNATLSLVSTVTLDSSFAPNNNGVIMNGKLSVLLMGYLYKYSLTSGELIETIELKASGGKLYSFNGNAFFTTGDVSKLWQL